jgi:hypothetical protein
MNIFNIFILFLTLFNNNISPDNVSELSNTFGIIIANKDSPEFLYELDSPGNIVMTFDEDFELYENYESNSLKGIYKLFYHDSNINAQILFYDNKPLVLSVHTINPLIKDFETLGVIRNLALSLGHKVDSWGALHGNDVHSVWHIYPKEVVAILVGLVENNDFANYNDIRVIFPGTRHPLQYDGPFPF